MKKDIQVGDQLELNGVQYQVINILSCKECCLYKNKACEILNTSINCGSKSFLGFKIISYTKQKQ